MPRNCFKRAAIVLTTLLCMPGVCTWAQVVGPQPPPPAPPKVNPVDSMKDKFKQMFKAQPADPGAEGGEDPAPGVKRPVRSTTIAPPPDPQVKIDPPKASTEAPPVKMPLLDDPKNPLGFAAAQNKLNQVRQAITSGNLPTAKAMLPPLRQWLIDATESHIELYKTLSKIPSGRTQAEFEKQVALRFALLRDESIYLAGRLNLAEKDYLKAVKELTQVVKSQPGSDIGIESYKLLQQIGFTEKLQIVQ